MSDIWFPWTHPTARKNHRCDLCSRRIGLGEKYVRGSGIWEGSPTSWKSCAHCEAMLDRIDYDDTFSPDDFENFEPRDMEELRAFVYYLRQWRNRDGDLYPIPFQKETQ